MQRMTPFDQVQKSIRDLHRLFDNPLDDETPNLFERIKTIEEQMADIISAQQRQENLMNLIIKLLSKDER